MNLKYQFYKGYFKSFDPRLFIEEEARIEVAAKNETYFQQKNKNLVNFKPDQTLLDVLQIDKRYYGDTLCQFKLKTVYPGLTSGIGYTHETGNIGEIKIGFHFDHTTGLPYLPGHTVKGTLRSVFPRYDQPGTAEDLKIKQAKVEFILSLLKFDEVVPSHDGINWVRSLEKNLFDGYENLPSIEQKTCRDIYLDARISHPSRDGKIIDVDFISPHGDKPWKNPVPLPFLKVLPGVEWEFSFLLHPVTIDNVSVSAKQKKDLFRDIIQIIGIGAKTNVGYGQFIKD